jgi:hypothetical protein
MSSSSSSEQHLYVIYCVDGQCDQLMEDPHGGRRQGGAKRMSCYDDHLAYQVATSSPNHDCFINKVAAVPMLADDGITMIGSCFLIKATRGDCERFIQQDPFFVNKVWESVSISRFSGAAPSLESKRVSPEGTNPLSAKKTAGTPMHYHSRRV